MDRLHLADVDRISEQEDVQQLPDVLPLPRVVLLAAAEGASDGRHLLVDLRGIHWPGRPMRGGRGQISPYLPIFF